MRYTLVVHIYYVYEVSSYCPPLNLLDNMVVRSQAKLDTVRFVKIVNKDQLKPILLKLVYGTLPSNHDTIRLKPSQSCKQLFMSLDTMLLYCFYFYRDPVKEPNI